MARCKRTKQEYCPPTREVRFGGNPDSILKQKPSWSFARCDQDGKWAFTRENIGDEFWTVVFPFLKNIETQTWGEIVVGAKKQHHTIEVKDLNKCAQDRLRALHIECDEVVSLRVEGKIRIYGLWQMAMCCILWYDRDHGDNENCVCRSKLKHT